MRTNFVRSEPVLSSPRVLRLLVVAILVNAVVSTGPLSAQGGNRVHSLTDTLPGAVGGVAVDRIGTVYVADFRESVWKVTPDGRASVFATGLYGASGNTIDSKGNLLQSNFSGSYISKINRFGDHEILADSGLSGPVGITVDPDDNAFVTNCTNNTISRVSAGGRVSTFATGDFFNCPNGITRDGQGNIYVVNFSDERMINTNGVQMLAKIRGGK